MSGAQFLTQVEVLRTANCDDGNGVDTCQLDGIVAYTCCGKVEFRESSKASSLWTYSFLPIPEWGLHSFRSLGYSSKVPNKAQATLFLQPKGTVAASVELIVSGTLKQIFSSAMVYWLYAPNPGTSPPQINPAIRSPTLTVVTLSPNFSTVPVKSQPRTAPLPKAFPSKLCTLFRVSQFDVS